jgi:GntR family transcriptional regulator
MKGRPRLMARLPMYQVIEDDLVAQIRNGELAPETKLPSEHDLAKRYGVSRMTVRQALDRLESERLVVRYRGSGNYVSSPAARKRRLNRLSSFSDELSQSNLEVTTRIILLETVQAPPRIVENLKTDFGSDINHFRRVRMVDGEVAALQDSWIPYTVAPGLAREGILGGSLYRTLRERFGVELRWAEQTMTATELTVEEADLLGTAPGTAVLSTVRTTYGSSGEIVEYAESRTLPQFPLSMRIDA